MKNPPHPVFRVGRQHDQRLLPVVALKRVQGHREPSRRRSVPPPFQHQLQLVKHLGVQGLKLVQFGPISRLREAAHRLAHLAYRTPFQREAVELDDRLIAQVQRPQPEGLLQRKQPLAGANRPQPEAPASANASRADRSPGNDSSRPTGSPEHSSTPFSIR